MGLSGAPKTKSYVEDGFSDHVRSVAGSDESSRESGEIVRMLPIDLGVRLFHNHKMPRVPYLGDN